MARVFPDSSGLKLPKPLSRVHSQMKKRLPDTLECRLALTSGAQPLPEFFIRDGQNALLLCVSSIDDAAIVARLQGDLFQSGSAATLLQDEFALQQRQSLDACCGELAKIDATLPPKCIAFPRASRAALEPLLQKLNLPDLFWLSKEEIAERLHGLLRPLQPAQIHWLLERYHAAAPQPVIPVTKGKAPPPQNLFFNHSQEELIKIDLNLSDEGRSLLESGTRLITGCAGSGKTVILLHRARLLAESNPAARILVLTHNRPLVGYLEERFKKLSRSDQVQFKTFYSWISEQAWSKPDRILKNYEAISRIDGLLASSSKDDSLKADFLFQEFNWIYDHDLIDAEAYLKASRRGRKRRLGPQQRERVHQLFSRYHEALEQEGQCDWTSYAWHYAQTLRSGRHAPAPYDAILIDEAQFFAPTWFAAVKAALKPTAHLLLTADPTQGFLSSGRAWLDADIDIVGRAHTLKIPYRNTYEILSFAARFYTARLPDEDEPVQLPDPATIQKLRRGHIPQLIQFDTTQSENNWVCRQVLQHLEKDAWRTEQILILHEDSQQIENIVRLLNKQRPDTAVNAKEDGASSDRIRVCSLNATTGLEAGIVFIMGIDQLFDRERDLQLDEADRPELTRRHTRKIYMALTRAMRECIVCFRREATRKILGNL